MFLQSFRESCGGRYIYMRSFTSVADPGPAPAPCFLAGFFVGMRPFRHWPASNRQLRVSGGIVKTVKVLRNVVGSAGLVFMGYVVLSVLPDLRRYIRITTM